MRLPTLSPTKYSTYLACPFKYNWLYRDPRGKWFVRSKNYYSFGTSLHHVLERFHSQQDITVTNVDEAIEALDRDWVEAGYSSAAEMSEALGEGKFIVEHYIRKELQREKHSQTLFVEKQLSKSYEGFRLVGRVDRIEEYEDGTIEIVDYKSGRQTVSQEDVASDIAMGIYQLLAREKYPDRHVQATIIALRSGDSATATMSDSEAEDFERDIVELGRIILAEDFADMTPQAKALCLQCDFLKLCNQYPDFDRELLKTLANSKE